MNRSALFVAPLVAALATAALGLAAQTASAAPASPAHKGGPAPVATSSHPSSKMPSSIQPAAALPGYHQVVSDLLTDPAGTQVSGTASCPTGNRLVGGGAIISSNSLAENLNASVPLTDGRSWQVFVNNASSADGTFRVYADCVTKAAGSYKVVVGTGVDNPTGAQTTVSVTCPGTTVPYGGGGFASSGSTAVNLNSSIPLSNGWRVDVNNASAGDDTATAYAICANRPTGYRQIVGPATTLTAGTQGSSVATCTGGTTVLGGGGFSSSGSTAVELNSTAPSGSAAWISYVSNSSTGSNTVTSYAVCGRTTA